MGFTREDIKRLRRCYRQGQLIRIRTAVYNNGSLKMIKTDAQIDGVYPAGIQVSFPIHHYPGGKVWHRRWVSWVDILTQKEPDCIYVTSGRMEEYVKPYKLKGER